MNYELIDIRTVMNDNDDESGLSFVEGERDIPFSIRRMYFIYEIEERWQKGFFLHEQSWQMFFCPNGRIDIAIDNGNECTTISLNDPSKGVLIYPGLWREIKWIDKKSVLCVATSERYEANDYCRDYDLYLTSVAEKAEFCEMEVL